LGLKIPYTSYAVTNSTQFGTDGYKKPHNLNGIMYIIFKQTNKCTWIYKLNFITQ